MKWFHPSRTIGILPWLSEDATNFLESVLNKNMTVCEFGGGGSTLWFAPRVKTVITFENNADWRDMIRQKAPDNVVLIPSSHWDMITTCDLLFIDGEPVEYRADWLREAEGIASKWIVLDNANRPEYVTERDGLKSFADLRYTADGNEGGTLHLVTEFWRVR